MSGAVSMEADFHLGPYERWTFTDRLGGPFALARDAGRTDVPNTDAAPKGPQPYTALMDGGPSERDGLLGDVEGVELRIPPLYTADGPMPRVVPFAMRAEVHNGDGAPERRLTAALAAVAPAGGDGPRFRVNVPIAPDAWPRDYDVDAAAFGFVPPGGAAEAAARVSPRAVVAVIDDGIPFANRAFLSSDGRTRVRHVWLQSGKVDQSPPEDYPPSSVPFGLELTAEMIEAMRDAAGGDEARTYRLADAVDPTVPELGAQLLRHGTHGAHVMRIAAGAALTPSRRDRSSQDLARDDPSLNDLDTMPDEVAIVAVQLPRTVALDTSGFGKDMYVLSALHYVFDRAARIADTHGVDPLPLIVNLSYGWSAGRHDGGSALEEAIQGMLDARRGEQPHTRIVMPMGNGFADAMHAAFTDEDMAGGAASVGWHVQPDDRTSSYLEIWLPEGLDPDGWRVDLAPPPGSRLDGGSNGGATVAVSGDPALDGGDPRRFVDLTVDGKVVGQLSADQHRGTRWRVLVALIPTAYTRGEDRRAPSGRWTVTVACDAGAAPLPEGEEVHLWVQRDDDPSDLRAHGRQSRLVNLPPYSGRRDPLAREEPVTGPVRPYGSHSAAACSPGTTRVTGSVASTGRPALYGSAGGVRFAEPADGGPFEPVAPWGVQAGVAAASDRSPLRPGVVSGGVLSGTTAVSVGTSTAAPRVARAMAIACARGETPEDALGPPPENPDAMKGIAPSDGDMLFRARTGPLSA